MKKSRSNGESVSYSSARVAADPSELSVSTPTLLGGDMSVRGEGAFSRIAVSDENRLGRLLGVTLGSIPGLGR